MGEWEKATDVMLGEANHDFRPLNGAGDRKATSHITGISHQPTNGRPPSICPMPNNLTSCMAP